MNRPFGKKTRRTVQQMCGAQHAAGWNTVREWTGPKTEATKTLAEIARRLAQ